MGLAELVEGLVWAAEQGVRVALSRGVWGRVFEPLAQRSGVFSLEEGGARIVVSRLGGFYGFVRAVAGDCVVEGLAYYRQRFVEFRPLRVSGECRGREGVRGLEVLED